MIFFDASVPRGRVTVFLPVEVKQSRKTSTDREIYFRWPIASIEITKSDFCDAVYYGARSRLAGLLGRIRLFETGIRAGSVVLSASTH